MHATIRIQGYEGDSGYTDIRFEHGKKKVFLRTCEDDTDYIVCRHPSDKRLNLTELRETIQEICDLARSEERSRLSVSLSAVMEHCRPQNSLTAKTLAEAFVISSYQFDQFKTLPDDAYGGIEFVTIRDVSDSLEAAIVDGQIIGVAVARCRDLCNTPASHMRPADLEDEVKSFMDRVPEQGKVVNNSFDPLLPSVVDSFGLIQGVHAACEDVTDALFIVLEYRNNPKNKNMDLVAIGKGVCFDTGGLSLKTSDGMLGMHHDMGGAAAAFSGFEAIVRLGLPLNVALLIPAVENGVSGSATRPGDILTSMGGTKVEVRNTDAEGRLILADALEYAGKYYPDAGLYLDFATLTGAAGIALATPYSAVFGENDHLVHIVEQCGKKAADPVWRMPLGPWYEKKLKSHVADIANVQSGASKNGGASIGGAFLFHFSRKAGISSKHVHVDIAPRMTDENGLSLGAGTLLLIQVAQELSKAR